MNPPIQLRRALIRATIAIMTRTLVTIMPATTNPIQAPSENAWRALTFLGSSDCGMIISPSVMGSSISGILIFDNARDAGIDMILRISYETQNGIPGRYQ